MTAFGVYAATVVGITIVVTVVGSGVVGSCLFAKFERELLALCHCKNMSSS